MTSFGRPMLTDFGLSRALDYSIPDMRTSSYGRLKGTSHWMAYELAKVLEDPNPEFICTKPSDMWAFGMVLYVCSCSALQYYDDLTSERRR